MTFEVAPKCTEIKASWDEAKLYCSFLDCDGKNDWRLPTTEELTEVWSSANDLSKPTKQNLNDMYDGRSDLYSFCYWTVEDDGNNAWVMGVPMLISSNYDKNGRYYVRAVRDTS